ncbi:MAG: hypothetical protein NVV74_25575 [Magnetospirillum sp.]|nr:hypothetical protein [Magnetospirillum sp.]
MINILVCGNVVHAAPYGYVGITVHRDGIACSPSVSTQVAGPNTCAAFSSGRALSVTEGASSFGIRTYVEMAGGETGVVGLSLSSAPRT